MLADDWKMPMRHKTAVTATAANTAAPAIISRLRRSRSSSFGVAMSGICARTGSDNFLREAHLEFLFTTVFTNQRPDGRFHHLRSLYWNTRFQHRFTLNDFTAPLVDSSWSVATLGGTGAATGGIIRGEPADPRTPTFTTAQADNCNAIAANATGEGSEVRVERSRW